MYVYLFGLVLFTIFGYGYSRDKFYSINLLSIVSLFLLYVFVFVFRSKSVGTDTGGYIEGFYNGYRSYNTGIEPLFLLLNRFLRFLHLSYFSLFFVVSFLIFVLFIKSFSRKNMYILFPLIYILVLIPSLNIQRQFLGLAFAFYGIKKNSKQSFFYFLIGFLFHKSIIFYVLIYIFSKKVILSQKFYYIFSIILLFLLATNNLLAPLLFLIKYTPYSEYQWILFNNVNVSVSGITYIKFFLYVLFFVYTKEIEDTKLRSFYNALICCLLIGEVAVKLNPIFFRLQVLFSPVVLIGIENVVNSTKRSHKLMTNMYLFILLAYTCMTFYLNLCEGVNQIVPFGLTNQYEL